MWTESGILIAFPKVLSNTYETYMFEETRSIKKTFSLWFVIMSLIFMIAVLLVEVYWVENVVNRAHKDERVSTIRQGFEEQLSAIRKRVREFKNTITPTPFL